MKESGTIGMMEERGLSVSLVVLSMAVIFLG
jgi:hypothetical protein